MTTRFLPYLFFLFFAPVILFGQLKEGSYLKIDYLKVENSDYDQFLEGMKSEMKKYQEQRVNEDEIIYWRLYKVTYPGNKTDDYNYVTVTTATSLNPFENESTIARETDDNDQYATIIRSLYPYHKKINSELWVVRNSIQADSENMEPARFVSMDYMNVTPGREFEYRMLEDEIASPLHRERMNMDQMDKWEMYELLLPGGTEYGYNFATGNFFNRLWHVEFGLTEELIKRTHTDTDVTSIFEQIEDTRDLVQHEMWELVDFIH
jgi:hypothetical protein